jgi:hypothetical protein
MIWGRWAGLLGAVVVLAGCARPAPTKSTSSSAPSATGAAPAAGAGPTATTNNANASASTAAGARPYYAPEADKFPLAKLAKDAGVTPDRLAQPQSPSDFDLVEQNRQTAIRGMKTGQKLPYTW